MDHIFLSSLPRKLGKALPVAIMLALIVIGAALALTLTSADGIWSNASGDGGTPTCLVYLNTSDITDENQVRYGDNNEYYGCPSDTDLQSGFGYDGNESLVVSPGDVFLLGVFTHYNRPIMVYDNFTQVDLTINLDFTDPDIDTSLLYTMQLDETPNGEPCDYPGSTICPDKVDFSDTIPDQSFGPIEGKYYKLQIVGFAPGTAETCEYDPAQTINLFYTEENQENHACLFARMLVEEPAIHIEKSPDTQYITTGSDAIFEIAVSNVGNVDLESVEVADTLTADCVRTGTWDGDTLAVGETEVYSCTAPWPVADGFVNTAVATGHPVTNPSVEVSDSDDATVYIRDGQITIVKDVVDEDLNDFWHYRDFPFTTDSTGTTIPGSFSLDDDCDPLISGCPTSVDGQDAVLEEKVTFTNLVQGTYTVTETVPVGTRWILAPQTAESPVKGIECAGETIEGSTPFTPTVEIYNVSPYTTGNVAISLEANQHVTCTFTNKPDPENTSITLSDLNGYSKFGFGLVIALGIALLLTGGFVARKRFFM